MMSSERSPLSAREPRSNFSSSLKAAGNVTVSPKVSPKLSRDIAPEVVPGGKPGDRDLLAKGLSAEIVLPSPRTPEMGEVRMRHRRRVDPGTITVHWGAKSSKVAEAGEGFGMKSQKCESVARTLRSAEVVGIAEYMNKVGETVYKSTVEEPLGKIALRGHLLPTETQETDFAFGKATPRLPYGSKESIFPPDGVVIESDEAKALYQRTHGDFDPGDMFLRGYIWPHAISGNPHFQFGAAANDAKSGNGVREALTANLLDSTGNFPATQIINHASECYQVVTADPMAKSRNRLQGSPKVPASHAYGKSSSKEPVSAGKLISGFYSGEECLPDKDLGRCIVQGRRNIITEAPLGAPTIRNDKVPPAFEKRSVASCTNYGDDLGAYGLLFPDKWVAGGLAKDDFQRRRGRQELLKLLEGAGHPMDHVTFEGVFCTACNMYGDDDPRASLEAITMVCGHPDFGAPPRG